MAELTPCKDCQHQISRSALTCPKCNSHTPHGVDCLVCKDDGGISFSAKKAHLHPHGTSNWGYTYYHPECIERVLAIPNAGSCSECCVGLSRSWSWKELCSNGHVSCKNCGVLNVFGQKGNCTKCQLPILAFHRMEDVGSVYSPSKYHEACFRTVQRLAAQATEVDPEKRKKSFVDRATLVGAIVGLVLGIAISSIIAVSGVTEHDVPFAAIIAAGIVGTFLGAFLSIRS